MFQYLLHRIDLFWGYVNSTCRKSTEVKLARNPDFFRKKSFSQASVLNTCLSSAFRHRADSPSRRCDFDSLSWLRQPPVEVLSSGRLVLYQCFASLVNNQVSLYAMLFQVLIARSSISIFNLKNVTHAHQIHWSGWANIKIDNMSFSEAIKTSALLTDWRGLNMTHDLQSQRQYFEGSRLYFEC